MDVLRLLVTPRWMGWTLLALTAVVVCGAMSSWQLVRAESPTGSLLNAGYALQWPVFGLFFAALWYRMLRAEARELAEVRATAEPGEAEAAAIGAEPGPSPFTPRPRGVAAGAGQGEPTRGSARAEYNALLAELAERDDPEERPRP